VERALRRDTRDRGRLRGEVERVFRRDGRDRGGLRVEVDSMIGRMTDVYVDDRRLRE